MPGPPTCRCSSPANPAGAAWTRARTRPPPACRPGRVRVLGRVSDADLAVLLRRATALVVPSRAEGFGLPLLEAMAVGTPVVTSDAPALVEVAGGAALATGLAPRRLADALARSPATTRSAPSCAPRGPRRAAGYTWDAAQRPGSGAPTRGLAAAAGA